MPMKRPPNQDTRPIASNRKAFHDYEVLERLEAGLALQGTEVKSARCRQVALTGGHVRIQGGEAWLCGARIAAYDHGNQFNHEPDRPRRLLLHKKEIHRMMGLMTQRGYTVVPLKVYFRRRRLKVELGVCRGKPMADKRQALRRSDDERDARRAMKRFL